MCLREFSIKIPSNRWGFCGGAKTKDSLFIAGNEAYTILDLMDDVTNSHTIGISDVYSVLKDYSMALGHKEALDLKTCGIDLGLSKFSKDYG